MDHIFGFAQDDATLEAARETIEQTLDVLDVRLGAVPYLAGEQFSLADIVYLPDLEYLMATPLQAAMSYRSNVADWWARCSDRPSWRKATGREAGDISEPSVERAKIGA